jgi:hypothetical protein
MCHASWQGLGGEACMYLNKLPCLIAHVVCGDVAESTVAACCVDLDVGVTVVSAGAATFAAEGSVKYHRNIYSDTDTDTGYRYMIHDT